jgi:lysophospholipase
VCLFQGRSEFIEKYFETVRDLRARGFAVATFDWRGQGMSDRALRNPRKGYVRNFNEYQIDLDSFVNDIVLPDCPPPFFALAQSMGATILLRAAHAGGSRWFDRMVLLAPMIGLPGMRRSRPTRMLVKTMRLLGLGASYVPGGDASVMMQRPFMGNLLTSDPVRYCPQRRGARAEPSLAIGWPTVAWTDSAFRVMGEMSEPGYPGRIRQPILIIAAGQDAIVSTPAIDEFAVRLRAGSHLIVPGSRHELLMEQDRFRLQAAGGVRRFRSRHPAVRLTRSPLIGKAIGDTVRANNERGTLARHSLERLQRRRVHALVSGRDDASAGMRRAALPGGDDPAGTGDDWHQRKHVVGLELRFDDEIDVARRQHAIGVAVAAVA